MSTQRFKAWLRLLETQRHDGAHDKPERHYRKKRYTLKRGIYSDIERYWYSGSNYQSKALYVHIFTDLAELTLVLDHAASHGLLKGRGR